MRLVVIMVICLVCIFQSSSLLASCVCQSDVMVKEDVHNSAAVISGRVLDILKIDPNNMVVQIENYNSWKEDEVYKKNSKRNSKRRYTYLLTTINKDKCGFKFKLGNEYLIYSYASSKGNLIVNNCSRTKSLQDNGIIEGDILELGVPLNKRNINYGMAR